MCVGGKEKERIKNFAEASIFALLTEKRQLLHSKRLFSRFSIPVNDIQVDQHLNLDFRVAGKRSSQTFGGRRSFAASVAKPELQSTSFSDEALGSGLLQFQTRELNRSRIEVRAFFVLYLDDRFFP